MIARADIIQELSQRIRQLERGRCQVLERSDRTLTSLATSSAASASTAWDSSVLIGQGWPSGCLVEWMSAGDGSGAASVAWLSIRQAVADELVVVIDRGEFYGPAAQSLGVNLSKTVFVRTERAADVLWSAEQALRTRGVGAVLCGIDQLSSRSFRRLQLAAETGGSLGMLLRPERARRQPSWAEYRFLVRPLASPRAVAADAPKRRLIVELLKARSQFISKSVVWELDDGPDARLCVAAELASATASA